MQNTLPYPTLIRDRLGQTARHLAPLLHPAPITAFVGGGGKTSTILALAQELAGQGAQVIVTTTTHILPVTAPLPKHIRVAGTPLPNGKLGPVEGLAGLAEQCDFLLIESDGSRSLPAKAPASHEPVIPPWAQMVVAVQGMTAFGQPIQAVCHRPQQVCALLGKDPNATLTAEDGAALLLSPRGQQKNVGNRPYALVLNQADGIPEQETARQIMALLPPQLPCAMTSYREVQHQ